jgi:hypothetical protein
VLVGQRDGGALLGVEVLQQRGVGGDVWEHVAL